MTTTGVSKIFVVVVLMCLKIVFLVSVPLKIYISILGGLEAEILIRSQIWSAIL